MNLVTEKLCNFGRCQLLSAPKTSNFKCLLNGCCDQHEWCRFWASIGECRTNNEWMGTNCQLACNTCRSQNFQSPSNHVDSFDNFKSLSSTKSCTQLIEKPSEIIKKMIEGGSVKATENTSLRTLLSIDDITQSVNQGCVPQLTSVDCSQSLCYHLIYRSFDGVCNNLNKPLQGAAFRPYLRHMPADYDNGFSEPTSSIHNNRPNVREASRILLSSPQMILHEKFNSLMMQWGQFISHDMAKTTLQPTANCKNCDPIKSKCVPVTITNKDTNETFKKKKCLKISRSAPVCGTNTPTSVRQQLNENTAYVDGSQIYGSSSNDLHKFRDGNTGFLKLSRFNSMNVLPFDQSKCQNLEKCSASFIAGDVRANLFLGLSSMHILFAREHNRIANVLKKLNPHWNGDFLFQETRKIVGAEIQAILFKEFLPKVLGTKFNKLIGPYKGYNSKIDATISNVFTTAAYRFGHGMIIESYSRLLENGKSISNGPFSFKDGVFKSAKILFEGGIDPILRGFWNTPVKKPHRMTPSITEKMFGSTDLGSLNIMRGREHGLPSYNRWREFCGLKSAINFEDLKDQILDSSVRKALADNYKKPDDVDLYVGAMVEDPVPGGLVGTTLSCLIGDQFKRTRDGDRFYYENPGIFTTAQLTELQKTSLARIICDNSDDIKHVPLDAFLLPSVAGGIVSCTSLPETNLFKWKS